MEVVEYIEETHQYLIDGILVPSVTHILSSILPNKYADVPKSILNNKADFGTHVHNAVQNNDPTGLTMLEKMCFQEWERIRDKFYINPIEQEQIVHYKNVYAGRFDMVADVNYYRCLIDIKTTATLDSEALSWQLGMYKMAYGKPIENTYCLWLPKKGVGELRLIIPKTEKEILKKLYELGYTEKD